MTRLSRLILAAVVAVSVLAVPVAAGAQEPVESPPAPPAGLQVDAVGDSGITVSWQAAASGTEPTGYKVRVNPDCGKKKTKTVDADTLSTTFGKVKFCQTYKVWVRATHTAGHSDKLATTWQRPQQGQEQGEPRGGQGNNAGQPACRYLLVFGSSYSHGRWDHSRIGSWYVSGCIPKSYQLGFQQQVWAKTSTRALTWCNSQAEAIAAAREWRAAGDRSAANLSVAC